MPHATGALIVRPATHLLLLGVLLLQGCASRSGGIGIDSRDAVIEAMLDHLLTVRFPHKDRVACVAYRTRPAERDRNSGDDPWLDRLAIRFGAVPGSECQIRDIVDPMTHQPTGEKAVYYRATLVEWQPGYARLYGSWLAASLYGESCAYVARFQRGAWQFQAEQACIYN